MVSIGEALWMGWPLNSEYAASSNADNAYRLQGKLLLSVGEMDTNVDPASTMQAVNALIKHSFEIRASFILALSATLTLACFSQEAWTTTGPPNAPATVELLKNALAIRYDGRVVFSAEVNPAAESFQHRMQVYRDGGRIQQVIVLTTLDWNKKIKIAGRIFASDESFPCEADRLSRAPLLVRHASGLSRNLRNRAVYDRTMDLRIWPSTSRTRV